MKKVELESLGAVHTHTHTHTSRLLVKNKKIDNSGDSNKSLLSRLLLLSFCDLKTDSRKGVTLISLVITIVLLIILASIGITSGVSVIRQSKMNRFTTEMKIMQTEVNDLYDRYSSGETDVLNLGSELDSQADEVFTSEASWITDKTGYRYYDQEAIQGLGIDGLGGEFYVNVEKRSVVSHDGFEHEGTTYYTLEQLPNGLYNVGYENRNTGEISFDLSCDNWTNGRSNIQVSNIEYSEGYIDKWQVQYKLEGQDYWSTSEDLSFFVDTPGMYTVRIVNGDIVSEEKQIEAVKANAPEILEGMTETTFKLPEGDSKGETIKLGDTAFNNNLWYDYGNSKWANSTTEDGSMWVWIPRFAYKITYDDPSDKSKGGTIDVRFLIGTSDQYYDNSGNIKTAKRATSKDEVVDTTSDYYVHPAFTDETNLDFANGGWDKELTGIWVAKFEAGYATGNNSAPKVSSNVNYSQDQVTASSEETGTGSTGYISARNWLDGTYGATTTSIKFPTFQPITYSMNYISISDSYDISRALTNNENIYGFNSSTTDSHLMKNSEWGAVAYLGWSKYGANGTEPYLNNINVNNNITSVYAVTGLTMGTTDEVDKTTSSSDITNINNRTGNIDSNGIYAWDQAEGQKASSTLNMYGVYDLSGGAWERTAGYIATGDPDLNEYGASVVVEGNISTKYATVYPHASNKNSNIDIMSEENYDLNTKIFGDAIRETSTSGTGTTSWNGDYSCFPSISFAIRGGGPWDISFAGLFYFYRTGGSSAYGGGFRPVLVAL